MVLRTVRNQSVTIKSHPLPSVFTRMCSKPLHFTPTVRHRPRRDAPVLGWFGWLLRLCQEVAQPELFSRRQLGYLCENVLDGDVGHGLCSSLGKDEAAGLHNAHAEY